MQKKTISSKKTKLFFLAIAFISFFSVSNFLGERAFAADGDTVFVYDSRDANDLKKEISGQQELAKITSTKVFSKDPDFQRGNASDKKTEFSFLRKSESGEYVYRSVLNCNYDSNRKLRTYMYVYIKLDSNFNRKERYSAQREIFNYRIIDADEASVNATIDAISSGDTSSSHEQLHDGSFGQKIGSSCVGLSTVGGRRSIVVDNYQELSSRQKEAWNKLGVASGDRDVQAIAARDDQDDADSDTADCNPAFGLGWIACSTSEFMANFAKDVFEKILAPMLENVPVGTDRTGENSGSFKAWSNFRIIANILLVVSLLAVVYSQARGGD